MAASDDETVKSLGIDPERLRTIIGLLAVFLTAAIISFTGVIGFVGLIAPHMARLIIGGSHQFYLPFAATLGALLLLLSDTIGKFIFIPCQYPRWYRYFIFRRPALYPPYFIQKAAAGMIYRSSVLLQHIFLFTGAVQQHKSFYQL